jgi:hypothetical protein
MSSVITKEAPCSPNSDIETHRVDRLCQSLTAHSSCHKIKEPPVRQTNIVAIPPVFLKQPYLVRYLHLILKFTHRQTVATSTYFNNQVYINSTFTPLIIVRSTSMFGNRCLVFSSSIQQQTLLPAWRSYKRT